MLKHRYIAEQRRTLGRRLRILARMIAPVHLRRRRQWLAKMLRTEDSG